MWFIGLLGLVGIEICGYIYYLHQKNFIKKKRYFKSSNKIDHKWMERYICEELEPNEVRDWIKNSISYNFSEEDSYYSNVPLDEIPRNKMLKWLAYHLYFKSLWQLSDDELDNSNKILLRLEDRISYKFKEIHDNRIYFLKFGNNHIKCRYRPILIYGGFKLLKNIVYYLLMSYGFSKYVMPNSGVVYLYYNNKDKDNTTIFIHGLGIGITPYINFILKLRDRGNVLIPIIPNISNMEFIYGVIPIPNP
jgi:hypothetical protein